MAGEGYRSDEDNRVVSGLETPETMARVMEAGKGLWVSSLHNQLTRMDMSEAAWGWCPLTPFWVLLEASGI